MRGLNISFSPNLKAYFSSFINNKYYKRLLRITLLAKNAYLNKVYENNKIDILDTLKTSIK